MTTIGANKNQLYGKYFILTLFGLLIGVFILKLSNSFSHGINDSQWLMPAGMTILLLSFSAIIFMQLRFIPTGVDIYDNNEIGITYRFAKPKYINLADIKTYAPTTPHTRASNYNGIIIYLTSGEKFLFSDFNLEDYSPIKSFLDEAGIKCTGKEDFGFISYYLKQLKK